MRSRWIPFLFLTAPLNGAAAFCPQPAPCRTVALHYDRAGNVLWANEGTLTGAPQYATGNVTVTGAGSTGYPATSATINLYLSVTGSQSWAAGLNGSTSDYALWFSDDHALDGDRPVTSNTCTNPVTGICVPYNTQSGLPPEPKAPT